eukprot:TRINITY_DN5456_c0_g1_i2.p1 TRINITY_DN5456_c0_g1~~TRINITY_DN5456_c0_g1_i2.p1  ORF type:complete len:156 (-),score=35.79 TRINITY_DN5456_c0_g1_i2:5-472(-)
MAAKITHVNDISSQISALVNIICRHLIKGLSWNEALSAAIDVSVSSGYNEDVKKSITTTKTDELSNLSKGGYAPDVLRASVYFMTKYTTKQYPTPLYHSLQFAGNSNFCPVLVGAFCGALYGEEVIRKDTKELNHCSIKLQQRLKMVNDLLCSLW